MSDWLMYEGFGTPRFSKADTQDYREERKHVLDDLRFYKLILDIEGALLVASYGPGRPIYIIYVRADLVTE